MKKQKIVIKVSMPNAKSRSEAMVLAAKANGVGSVGITGDLKDRLEVVGEGVDVVGLVKCLRKKLCSAEILVVEEVKEKKADEKKADDKKKPEEPKPCSCPPGPCRCPGYYYPMPMVVCEEPPPGSCHIM